MNDFNLSAELGKEAVDYFTDVALFGLEVFLHFAEYDERQEKKRQYDEWYDNLSDNERLMEDIRTSYRGTTL